MFRASFVDPTVVRDNGNVVIGQCVYVGPFATLLTAVGHRIQIGNGTNVQDSVTLEATKADIIPGDHVILAHGATIKGYATIGEGGRCNAGDMCPPFVGFNAEVDGVSSSRALWSFTSLA